MNYTPLPSTLISQQLTTELLPTQSPYKKALATILIALFLGIGTTYIYFRNSSSKKNSNQVAPIITVIPSPLPTIEPIQSAPTSNPEPSGQESLPTDSIPTIQSTPSLFFCSAGTVKVCQGGDCECVANNQ